MEYFKNSSNIAMRRLPDKRVNYIYCSFVFALFFVRSLATMEANSCFIIADLGFGPSVPSCLRRLDFTVFFEETILSIGPSALFICLSAVRLFVLLGMKLPVVHRGRLHGAKLV
jgi:hypothetical protein